MFSRAPSLSCQTVQAKDADKGGYPATGAKAWPRELLLLHLVHYHYREIHVTYIIDHHRLLYNIIILSMNIHPSLYIMVDRTSW